MSDRVTASGAQTAILPDRSLRITT